MIFHLTLLTVGITEKNNNDKEFFFIIFFFVIKNNLSLINNV